MPRAYRHYVPGQIWHITHRCHDKKLLLKFKCDRRNWIWWLYQARKRLGLQVLNYMITSNHIHLLVADDKPGVISRSMQLVAGQTAQAYNRRHQRKGAFWEDRYHATSVGSDKHLVRCLIYIDLNMVRAGVVQHPSQWDYCGYAEIQQSPDRWRIVNKDRLTQLLGFTSEEEMQVSYRGWIADELRNGQLKREAFWTESIAFGSKEHVLRFKSIQGFSYYNRELEVSAVQDGWLLKENVGRYDSFSH